MDVYLRFVISHQCVCEEEMALCYSLVIVLFFFSEFGSCDGVNEGSTASDQSG